MKSLLIITGMIFAFLSNIAIEANQQNTEIEKRLTAKLPNLNEVKIGKLMTRVGRPVPDGLYSCLCHATGAGGVGGGVIYKPGAPCEVTGVLGGKSKAGFPNDPGIWKTCINNSKYDDGATIVDTIGVFVDSKTKLNSPYINNEVKYLLKRNGEFKQYCLPSLSTRTIKGLKLVEQNEKGQIVGINPQGYYKEEFLKQAVDIATKASDICEESVAVNLFINSRRENSIPITLLELATTWAMPDISNVSSVFKPLSILSNTETSLQLFTELEKNRSIDTVFQGAFSLFQESKKLSTSEVNDSIKYLKNEINKVTQNINKLETSYQEQYQENRRETSEAAASPIEQADDAKWNAFNKEQKLLKNKLKEKIADLFLKRANLLLKNKVLTEYRLPLSRKTCNEFLAERESNCKEQLARSRQKAAKNALERASEIPYGGHSSPSGVGGVVEPIISPQK